MSFLSFLRRYRLPSFLFALCLAVILLSGEMTFLQSANAIPPQATPSVTPAISITEQVKKTVLENGLTVLTKAVPTAPVVTVQVWYRVGSRNEAPGVNGIAHQLEHLMFKGTKDRPIQFGRLFSALGSQSNAFTSYDQTAYFGTVERNKLRSLLALEADRMQSAVIGADQLTSEKRVVISELQGYENSPSYRLDRAVMRAAFPDSPYGLTVGGTKADVQSFTVNQVREYYRNYYSPDNAVLIVVGDIQTEPTLNAVKELFGKVPSSKKQRPTIPKATAPSIQKSSSAKAPIVLKEPGSASLLQAVYPLPNVTHPDVPALHLFDLVLTQGRSSRLYQALVESGLASDFGGYPANMISGGWYGLSATAAPKQELSKIDQTIQTTLSDLRNKPITPAELTRAKVQLRSSVLLRNRDITGQAMQLGDDQTTAGDYQFTDRFLAAVDRVTIADIQRVAKTYFDPSQQTLGFFEPTQLDAKAGGSVNAGQTAEQFNLGSPVDPAEVAKYLPPVERSNDRPTQSLPQKVVLSNGLKLLMFKDPSTPTISLNGYINAGSLFDSTEKAGLSKLTADNLTNGTQTKDALTLAKTLEDRGINLSFNTNREGVSVAATALSENLPVLVQTLSDVMQNAAFPDRELELSRQRTLTSLKVQMDSPAYVARRVFQQIIYPFNHPFYSFPTSESLQGIQRSDVLTFYKTHYRPDNTTLAIVGDFDPDQVKMLMEKELGTWKASGKPPAVTFPSVSPPANVLRADKVIPGKTQSITFLGYAGIDRKNPKFYSAEVMNQILGGDTLSSRLGTEIRDRQGLTYGIYSYFQAGVHPGPFLVSMQTAPEDTDKAIASTLKVLEQIRNQGVSTSEVLNAQRSLTSSYPVELANPDNLAEVILMNEVYGLNPAELRQYPNRIERVTQAQVSETIQELLHPSQIVVVTAGGKRNQ
jgi:zinc protease